MSRTQALYGFSKGVLCKKCMVFARSSVDEYIP